MRIEPLADHEHLARTLARWHADEWSDLVPSWSYETLLAELAAHTRRDTIPLTLVALEGAELLGSASLLVDDLPGWEHLTPWLASVFVAPAARGRGVGTRLVTEAAGTAQRLGVERLHLFTAGQADFYRRLGWRDLARTRLGDHPVEVLSLDLKGP
jgi:predicted N-acetyltransferase YhbS